MQKIIFVIFLLFLVQLVDADLVINEIMYNPSGVDGGHEWIEIFNNESGDINVENYTFFENNQNHRLSLANGDDIIISENEYFIIADNAETFLQDYENYEGTVLDSSFSLSNSGEYLALKDNERNVADEVNYSSDWGNREGYTLELMNPGLDNNNGLNWNSSLEEDGTPGNENSVFIEIIEDEELPFNHRIQLNYGWNLISSYIVPVSMELENIFVNVIDEGYLEIVRDQQGRFFNPRIGFNNIPEWNPYESYWVKVNWDSSIIISGDEIISLEIPLRQGWNNIVYPLNTTHSMNEIIEEVLNPLGNNFIIVKDENGRFYSRRYNYNNILEFAPGRGYQIKVNEETVLDFSPLD